MGTVHTVAVHFRYVRYMRRLANEFLGRNPIKQVKLASTATQTLSFSSVIL